MDVVELTRKAIELALRDEKTKQKIKDMTTTILMVLTNGEELCFAFSVDKGKMEIIEGKMEDPEFEFTATKEDFYSLMSGKTPALIAMATKKIKMTKGNWAQVNKLTATLGGIPKFGKQIVAQEREG
ncbi:MAG: SCP2 sterol-binding domain-containing protein [Kiritimatiellae bacterium]|nr:SCP2 sterol-binding domain-containing protein [Kiritimatiellia bacterium]